MKNLFLILILVFIISNTYGFNVVETVSFSVNTKPEGAYETVTSFGSMSNMPSNNEFKVAKNVY